jgi:hypothetical protein
MVKTITTGTPVLPYYSQQMSLEVASSRETSWSNRKAAGKHSEDKQREDKLGSSFVSELESIVMHQAHRAVDTVAYILAYIYWRT